MGDWHPAGDAQRRIMGKLIVFEGTDGSGKATQARRLAQRLEAEGVPFRTLEFPQYDKESSSLIRMYLRGDFGKNPEDVNAYAASAFFAVDRYASYRLVWKDWYERGGLVLSDRYTTSNAVHQASKEPKEKREAFLAWLYDLEYGKLGLPKPDLVLYLDVPLEYSERMMRHREEDTGTTADIHERDHAYLRTCREMGAAAADYYGWTRISCVKNGKMRGVEDIHEEIFRQVKKCLEGE